MLNSVEKEVILIVDDDSQLQELLVQYLVEQGFTAYSVVDGEAMDVFLKDTVPDLIILDLMLPGEDGLSIARRLRAKTTIPVIMLSARGDEVDKIIGLEVGADDYLSKPFNPRELLARLRSVLRRSTITSTQLGSRLTESSNTQMDEVVFGCFKIKMQSRTLWKEGKEVDLTSGEISLLLIFSQYPNRVLSREKLMDLMSVDNTEPFDRSIDVRITRLRKKLEDNSSKPRFIRTVWGEGYRFTPNEL